MVEGGPVSAQRTQQPAVIGEGIGCRRIGPESVDDRRRCSRGAVFLRLQRYAALLEGTLLRGAFDAEIVVVGLGQGGISPARLEDRLGDGDRGGNLEFALDALGRVDCLLDVRGWSDGPCVRGEDRSTEHEKNRRRGGQDYS
ncbi:hypothetical protein SDC9_135447 [bioreactor metagenome]|uniref:Uncharacterized protein n=1 Tax=bioreactor metagenome TaxID=1076179 RepID=A0A645DGK2_9ZZZZ